MGEVAGRCTGWRDVVVGWSVVSLVGLCFRHGGSCSVMILTPAAVIDRCPPGCQLDVVLERFASRDGRRPTAPLGTAFVMPSAVVAVRRPVDSAKATFLDLLAKFVSKPLHVVNVDLTLCETLPLVGLVVLAAHLASPGGDRSDEALDAILLSLLLL